jgi:hypothetical protein
MDPRVSTPPAEIERQFHLSRKLDGLLHEDMEALEAVQTYRADRRNASRDEEAADIENALRALNSALGSLFRMVERTDRPPTSQVVDAIGEREVQLREVLQRWRALERR